jgi:hypothetical protein
LPSSSTWTRGTRVTSPNRGAIAVEHLLGGHRRRQLDDLGRPVEKNLLIVLVDDVLDLGKFVPVEQLENGARLVAGQNGEDVGGLGGSLADPKICWQ